MNILCNQKTLAQAITNAQKAINNKTNIELLRGILLTAKNNSLIVTGYDNEISIETTLEAQVNSEGSIVMVLLSISLCDLIYIMAILAISHLFRIFDYLNLSFEIIFFY